MPKPQVNKDKTKRRPARQTEKNDPNKMRVNDKMPVAVGADNGTRAGMSVLYKPPKPKPGIKTIKIKTKRKPGPGKNKPTPV